MKKHAYLIMAHNNFEQLKLELKLLDDVRNDIYIHIDKKAKNVNLEDIKSCVHNSNVFFSKRYNVKWAGYSGIQCEIELLKEALSQRYEYYHLLSGMDLPLKKQDEIHKFFEEYKGKEFISYDREQMNPIVLNRIKYYYFFQDVYGRNRKNPFMVFLYLLDKMLNKIQKICKVNRIKNYDMVWQKGPNWFSITHDLAEYVVKKEKWIKKVFFFSISGDEMFLQTIVKNSKYKDNLFMDGLTDEKLSPCMRKIDWTRGKPYIWREKDFDELIESPYLFARKFDINVDKAIIEKIETEVLKDTLKNIG